MELRHCHRMYSDAVFITLTGPPIKVLRADITLHDNGLSAGLASV